MVTRKAFIGTTVVLAVAFGGSTLVVRNLSQGPTPSEVKTQIDTEITHRSAARTQQFAVTGNDLAAQRVLICRGLAGLPQTAGVVALESIPYQTYLQPTMPICPAPMPGGPK